MHRTQIYLDQTQYEMLRSRSRREGKSLAAVIREALDAHFGDPAARGAHDPFLKVIGIGKGDGAAVAENYQDYLYGEKN